MKKIGLQQWVVDLLCEEDILEEKKKLTSDDEFQYGKKKLADSSSNDEYICHSNRPI